MYIYIYIYIVASGKPWPEALVCSFSYQKKNNRVPHTILISNISNNVMITVIFTSIAYLAKRTFRYFTVDFDNKMKAVQ